MKERLLLAIHSYPGANETLQRHWPRFLNAGADEIWTIGTTGGGTWGRCLSPGKNLGAVSATVEIGANDYINAAHLPNRLLDTLEVMLTTDNRWLMIAEYDTLFFAPIMLPDLTRVAAHWAGTSDLCSFYHNPWLFERTFARNFLARGREIVAGGIGWNTPESSPDVFFGLVCQSLNQEIQYDLWTQFSRNSYDIPGDLELARDAYRNGMDVIHGIKKKEELEFILS